MAVKVWFEDDIRNALAAAVLATDLLPNSPLPEAQAYLKGYRAAISVLCVSFGIQIPRPETPQDEHDMLPDSLAELRHLDTGALKSSVTTLESGIRAQQQDRKRCLPIPR